MTGPQDRQDGDPRPDTTPPAVDTADVLEPNGGTWVSTLLVTNATKLAGLYLAINELVIRDAARDTALAIAALMMLGAQTAEEVIGKFIDRMFSNANGRR
jgi:hypothetical protein